MVNSNKYKNVVLKSKNQSLCLEYSSVLFYFTLAEKFKGTIMESEFLDVLIIYFYNMLSFCDSKEDLRDLDNFFYNVSKCGDIGKEFYEKISNYINFEGKIFAINKLKELYEDNNYNNITKKRTNS